MTARGLRRHLVAALLAAVLPPFLATGSLAASIPSSAESRALGLDPILRGGATLAFLHPQQALLQPAQFLVFDTGWDPYAGARSPRGLGGLLVAGGQRLFLFSTRDVVSAGSMSGVHAGWAGPAGALRLGLSAGATWT